MLITEIQRTVLKAASSILKVYNERYWVDASMGETRLEFIAALKDETTPIRVPAHVEFGFDALYTGALVYGAVYDGDGEKIEPYMELEVDVELPTDDTETIDMQKVQLAVAGIIGKDPVIVHNERLARHPLSKCFHEYTIEYYWTLAEDSFLAVEMYEGIFLELERLLKYIRLAFEAEC